MQTTGSGPTVRQADSRLVVPAASRRRPSWLRSDTALAVLVLSPSIIAVAVFIYSFIIWSFSISAVKWNSAVVDHTFVGLDNWLTLFTDSRFQTDVRNLVLYAAGFMGQCIVLGFLLAALIDQK